MSNDPGEFEDDGMSDLDLTCPECGGDGMDKRAAEMREYVERIRQAVARGDMGHITVACDEMLSLAEELERMQWIPVTERLPVAEGKYACVVHFKAVTRYASVGGYKPAYTTVRWLDFQEGVFWLNKGAPPAGMISHWMPLPPVPGKPAPPDSLVSRQPVDR